MIKTFTPAEKSSLFLFLATTCLSSPVNAEYTPITPYGGDSSSLVFNHLGTEEATGEDVFLDYEIKEDGSVVTHYYRWEQKGSSTSHDNINSPISGNRTDKQGNFVNSHIEVANAYGEEFDLSYSGVFINSSASVGGAISGADYSLLENSFFSGNQASGDGGAFYNSYTGYLTIDNGSFVNNSAGGSGGAVFQDDGGTLTVTNSRFIRNTGSYDGGAIFSETDRIQIDNGDFYENSASSGGGAIYAYNTLEVNNSRFYNNQAYNGGAILGYNSPIYINDSIFFGNTSGSDGGAVYTYYDVDISADGADTIFDGNTAGSGDDKTYNAVFTQYGTVSLSARNEGQILFNDTIDGGAGYTLNINGDESGRVIMNNQILNAGSVNLSGTTLKIGSVEHSDGKTYKGGFGANSQSVFTMSNATLDLHNNYFDDLYLKEMNGTNATINLNIGKSNTRSANGWVSDHITLSGELSGHYNLNVYSLSDAEAVSNTGVLFLSAANDTDPDNESFSVYRVYGSPYKWEAQRNINGEQNGSFWYLTTPGLSPDPDPETPEPGPDDPTPDPKPDPEVPDIKPTPQPMPADGGKVEVTPEVIGSQSLPSAAIAQNANLIYNVMNKVSSNRMHCPGCGFYDYYWNGEAFHNLWVNPVYTSLSIKSPTDIDADVWGVEAGGDLQHDLHNKIGLFVSYRKGNYDMNGDGKHYYSTIGSEVDIDSYLAGLYYRYDRNNWYAFATLYGGIQQADIKTDDGVKSDTDGIEFGGSVEAGYDYALTDTVYLTPSLGVFYTQVNYDDATDNVGKKAKYGDLQQIELEAGVKLTKAFWLEEGYANLYVKPSVVQTIVDGDEVNITGLGKVNTLDDETLGRIELGGRYGFTDQLSAYGWANYTFGSDYDATTVGLGLNYAW